MAKVNLGDEYTLYLDTANDWNTPTWVEVECIEDLALDAAPIVAQINKRGKKTPGYKRGRLDTALSAKLLSVPTDSVFQTLEAAVFDVTNDGTELLHLAIVRGKMTTAGNDFWENDYVVTGSPLDANLDNGASYDLEFKPAADSDNDFTPGTTS